MATTRKAARRSSARRAAGKLKRSPKPSTVRARAARPNTRRGAERKPGTLRGRSRKKSRAAASLRSKSERRRRALKTFGDRLLTTVEGRPGQDESQDAGNSGVGDPQSEGAPSYYTGHHPPTVAEPGTESMSRKDTLH